MTGRVRELYVTPKGGAPMESVTTVEALAGRGLRGDRYCERTGYWTDIDECQVTLIEVEDLETIKQETGLNILNGEHRRNIITEGIRLAELAGKQFQIGTAVLEFDRPRPPCAYIQSITQPGMTRALVRRGGICARVIQAGSISPGDSIKITIPAP
ncbi:MAG: MOSC domain-containing protein [Thermaerobacterales bacterium]